MADAVNINNQPQAAVPQNSAEAVTSGFNINSMNSFLEYFQQLNSTVSSLQGIECKWMRAIPHINSEDVIFQEYTLSDVECPRDIKIMAQKEYNVGNNSVDLFGVSYEAPFEVQIDKSTWTTSYPELETMPQKGDLCYVAAFNRLYEVQSSEILYTFLQQETGYKCLLVKYKPNAARRENQAVADTISQMTVSETELFADEISKDVADIVDTMETSHFNMTEKDEYKLFGSASVVSENVVMDGNIIQTSYYTFSGDDSITYKRNNIADTNPYRMFSAWIRPNISSTKDITVKTIEILSRDKGITKLSCTCDSYPKRGFQLTMKRGQFRINITFSGLEESIPVFIASTADIYRMNQTMTGWNLASGWTISDSFSSDIFSGYDTEGNKSVSIVLNEKGIMVSGTQVNLNLPSGEWSGISVVTGPESKLMYIRYDEDSVNPFSIDVIPVKLSCESFNDITKFTAGSPGADMTNIRYFSLTEMPSDKNMRLDLMKRYTDNASKAIILDSCGAENKMAYVGQPR